jgi:hypothetical protein
VELYRQRKTEELGEKSVPVPLCPPQIPSGLTQARTRPPRMLHFVQDVCGVVINVQKTTGILCGNPNAQ